MEQEEMLQQIRFVSDKFAEMKVAMERAVEALRASQDLIALITEENERLAVENGRLRLRTGVDVQGGFGRFGAKV